MKRTCYRALRAYLRSIEVMIAETILLKSVFKVYIKFADKDELRDCK